MTSHDWYFGPWLWQNHRLSRLSTALQKATTVSTTKGQVSPERQHRWHSWPGWGTLMETLMISMAMTKRNRWRLEVPTIYMAYLIGLCTVRRYISKIWPHMVQYLHFRIMKVPLIIVSGWILELECSMPSFTSEDHKTSAIFIQEDEVTAIYIYISI